MKWLLTILILWCSVGYSQEDDTYANRFDTEIDVHFNFGVEEWDKIDAHWNKQLLRTWFTPWKEWIPKTSQYKNSSPEGQAKWMSQAGGIDERISLLRDKAGVFIHYSTEYPQMAYCVLPRGFKLSRYSDWKKLPKDSIPGSVLFFPDLIEYFVAEYNRENAFDRWWESCKDADYARRQRESNKAMYHAVKWCKEKPELMRVTWVSFYNDTFTVDAYNRGYESNHFQIKLSVTGYKPSPAVAWRCPPSLPPNPLKHQIYKK